MSIFKSKLDSQPSWFSICLYFFLIGLPCLIAIFTYIDFYKWPDSLSDPGIWFYSFLFGYPAGFLHTFLVAALFWLGSKIYFAVTRKNKVNLVVGGILGCVCSLTGVTSFAYMHHPFEKAFPSISIVQFYLISMFISTVCGVLASRTPDHGSS